MRFDGLFELNDLRQANKSENRKHMGKFLKFKFASQKKQPQK